MVVIVDACKDKLSIATQCVGNQMNAATYLLPYKSPQTGSQHSGEKVHLCFQGGRILGSNFTASQTYHCPFFK